MDEHEFRKDFMEYVRSEAAASGEGSCAAFTCEFADRLIKAEVLTDFTPAFYDGLGKRNKKMRVDGYAYDDVDQSMTLVITDYDGTDIGRPLTKTLAEQLKERVRYFADQALNGTLHDDIEISTPCADLVEQIRAFRADIIRYHLLVFTDATMSSSLKDLEPCDINGIKADTQVWDLSRLYKICSSALGRQAVEINFTEYSPKGLPCLECNCGTKVFKSYLCVISGEMLADIYDKYGSILLEGNVRSFLSTKGKVNKKILETIKSCPDRFFAYNNGISVTAMDVHVESSEDGKYITFARDFQIINGGQTTASLSNARWRDDRVDLSEIYVQMKLTAIDESSKENAAELVENISRSSNSQNKVSEADFFANHKFHIRMEQFSRRLFARATDGAQYETKWFYERARGQYLQAQMHKTSAEKKQFQLQHPKNQVMTKTDFAKARNTWKGLPHVVSKGSETNFLKFAEIIKAEWDVNDAVFGEKYFKETAALMLIFRNLERQIPHQPWYTGGYRANVVTYSIALFHTLIQRQFKEMDLDLSSIWNRQAVPDAVSSALLEIAAIVYQKITDRNRPIDNVTQWCKREDCWKLIKNTSFTLPAQLKRSLISKDDMHSEERDAEKAQRVLSNTELQMQFLQYPRDTWERVLEFCKDRLTLIPKDKAIISRIIASISWLPNPEQSGRILEVLDRAKKEGFKL